MAYTFTTLPSEVTVTVPSALPDSDIENDYNKPLRAIKEVIACINGADAGTGSNGIALQDYTSLGINDRLNVLEANDLIGSVKFVDTTATSKPRHILPTGQTLSRTTYADYFAQIGTTHGNGDGSGTTFTALDMRGRMPLVRDNLGGSAANRVPSASSIGATGGNYQITQATNQVADHLHDGTVDGSGDHAHSISHSDILAGGGAGDQPGNGPGDIVTSTNGFHYHTFTSNGNNGSVQPMGIMNPYVVLAAYLYVGV